MSNSSKGKARARSKRTRDSGSSHASPKMAGAPLDTLDPTWTSAPELSSSRSAPPGKIHQGGSVLGQEKRGQVWENGIGCGHINLT